MFFSWKINLFHLDWSTDGISVAILKIFSCLFQVIKESNDIEKLINDSLSEKIPREELRLPKSLFPTHYRLWIHPILDEDAANNFTFTGRVEIQINATSNTNKIILHWDELNITDSDIKIYTLLEVWIKIDQIKYNIFIINYNK